MSPQTFKVGDRVRIVQPHALEANLYPPELIFRVVAVRVLEGRERVGACCGPFPGYPYGVERWDDADRWERVPEVLQ